MFHYNIRPDGSIRTVSQKLLPLQDGDTLVSTVAYYKPSRYRYDYATKQMVGISASEIAQRRGVQAAAAAQALAAKQGRRNSMKSKRNKLDAETKEFVDLLLEDLGIEL